MRTVMMVALAAALPAAVSATEPPPELTLPLPVPEVASVLPTDPLQRIAYRAVILKEWPDSPDWKLCAYRLVLDRDVTVEGQARRTNYCPSCSGRTCADGSPVRRGICAASRNVPMGSIIWLASDGLLKVTDRGSAVRVEGGCQRRGENANFDVWCPRCPGGCWTGPGTLARVPWAMVAANW